MVFPSPSMIEDAVKEVEERKPNAVKRFFDSLFNPKQKVAPNPQGAKPTTESERAVPALPLEDKVVRGEDGQWQVTSKSAGFTDALVHKFGDLITAQSHAEKLHLADWKQDYQLGECGVLAGELWNLNENVEEYYIMRTDDQPDLGTHHFVKLYDGTYVDSLGLWSEKAFLEYWKDIDPTARIATFDADPNPVQKRNPKFKISNPELFNTLTELIEKHTAGKQV